MARKLKRIEIWTTIQADSGTMLAVINDWISASDTREVGGKEILHVELRRETANWSSLQERRVIRTVFSDGTWDEWRIANIRQTRDGSNRLLASVDCESPKYDLGSTLVTRTEADGTVNPYFELYGLTPTDHLGIIMDAAPVGFSAGTVGSSVPMDGIYDWDNPLSAAAALAQTADLEVEVTGSSAGYTVDLPVQVGSTADTVYFRYARNMLGVVRNAETQSAFATRVYPRGAGAAGERPTIADAAWLVSAASSVTVTLSTAEGRPAPIADLLNSIYAESSTGKRTQITDTSSGGVLTLAAGHSISTGERVRFRSSTGGNDLVWLEHPANSATYGEAQRVIDRADIPAIDNLANTPFLDEWSVATVPDNWNKIGAPTVLESTASINRRYGVSSARIQAASSGLGVQTDIIVIEPSTVRPFFTAQIALRVISGTVKLEMVDTSSTQDGLYPPVSAEPAITTVKNAWVENLGIGGSDLNEVSSTGIRIRVTSYSTGASEWYLDAASVTQTAAGVEQFYDGRASNDLWLAGVEYLQDNSTPRVAFSVNVIDLERLEPSIFSQEPITLGGTVQVTDSDLGLDFQTRVLEITRDLDKPGLTNLKLSNRPEDLTGLGVPGHRQRAAKKEKVPRFQKPGVEITSTAATSTGQTFKLTGRSDGQLLALLRNVHDSTAAAGAFTRSPSTGWKESGHSVIFATARPPAGSPGRVLEAFALDQRGARGPTEIAEISNQSFIIPTVQAVPSQSTADNAVMTLAINDPQGHVTHTAYDSWSTIAVHNPGAPSTSWDIYSTAQPLTHTEPIREKHPAQIVWAVGYTSSTGGTAWISSSHSYDIDHDAKLTGLSLGFEEDGLAVVTWQSDEDWKDGYLNIANAGSAPSAPSTAAFNARLSGKEGTLTLSSTEADVPANQVVQVGELAWLKVIARNHANEIALTSTGGTRIWELKKRRGDTEFDEPSFRVQATRSGTTITITINGKDLTESMTAWDFSYSYPDAAGGANTATNSTSWTTNSWSAGSRIFTSTLNLTVEPGVAGEFSFRASYLDNIGVARTKGLVIALENIDEVQKDLMIPAASFKAQTDALTWTQRVGRKIIGPRTVNVATNLIAPVLLADAVEVDNIWAWGKRTNTGDVLDVGMWQGNVSGFGRVGLGLPSTSWAASGSFAEKADGGNPINFTIILPTQWYWIEVDMTIASTGNVGDVALGYVKIQYSAFSMDRSI